MKKDKYSMKNINMEFHEIFLIDSGNCNYIIKALNSVYAGSKLVIIIREKNDLKKNKILNKKNDYYYKNRKKLKKKNENKRKNSSGSFFYNKNFNLSKMVDIPVLSVSYMMGERLKKFLFRKKSLILKFQMNIPKEDISKINFYIKKNDLVFYQFIYEMKKLFLQFENKIKINFIFFENYVEKNSVDTNLLEKQMNCVSFKNVFDIIFSFQKNCKNITSKCFNENMELSERSVFLSYRKCLEGKNLEKKIKNKKKIIKNNKSYIKINGIIYKGTKKTQNFFEAMCHSFVKSPDNCIFLNNKYTSLKNYSEIKKKKKKLRFVFILLNGIALIFLLSLAGFVLILVYGKIYERILNENVENIVQNTINNYNNTNLDHNE